MAIAPIPAGYASVTPYLIVRGAAKAIDFYQRAFGAGATVKLKRPVADQFYGDRTGTLADPFGHVWSLATHVEDVAPEEMDRRLKAMMKPAASA